MKNARPRPAAADPHEQPYPGFAREQAARQARADQAIRAGAAPLPGPLREAFAAEPVTIAGLTLQPVNAWLMAILTRIQSPILDIIGIYRFHAADLMEAKGAARKKIEARVTAKLAALPSRPETLIETVFAFVTPVEELQRLLDAGKFSAAALAHVGKRLHPAELAQLEQAIGAHFAASFGTVLELKKPDNPEDGTVFSQPPAAPTTASAGGSKPSEL